MWVSIAIGQSNWSNWPVELDLEELYAIGQSNWPVKLDYTEVVLVVELVEASTLSALSGRKAMRLDEIRH
jgi:hypothetical protein